MYIGDYLARRELYSPDRTAIIDTGKTPEWRLTYRQMNERANRLANWLRDFAGVGKGIGWPFWLTTGWSISTCSSLAASWGRSIRR